MTTTTLPASILTSDPTLTPASRGVAAPKVIVSGVSTQTASNAQGGWKISRRAPVCGACQRMFDNGSLVFSTLSIFDAKEMEAPVVAEPVVAQAPPPTEPLAKDGATKEAVSKEKGRPKEKGQTGEKDNDNDGIAFVRIDRCGVCHQKRERGRSEIVWRTQHEEAPKKPKLDLVSLTEVFRQLVATENEQLRELLFLVSLLLLRHRRLKVVRTFTEGERDYLVMAFPRSKENFNIEVSELPKERLEALRAQLTAVFEGGELLPAESAAGPGPEPAAEAQVVLDSASPSDVTIPVEAVIS